MLNIESIVFQMNCLPIFQFLVISVRSTYFCYLLPLPFYGCRLLFKIQDILKHFMFLSKNHKLETRCL